MKKFFENIFYIVLAFSVGYVIFFHGPVGLLKVTSGSMEPFLEIGDVCIVDKTAKFGDLKVGEVVVFYYGNDTLACHRIVGKTNGGFKTKGDANEHSDVFLLTKDNFFGRLIISI